MKKLYWNQLSGDERSFVSAFVKNEKKFDYLTHTRNKTTNKTTIVLKSKYKLIFHWDKIQESAK